jgi:hypothetical protein
VDSLSIGVTIAIFSAAVVLFREVAGISPCEVLWLCRLAKCSAPMATWSEREQTRCAPRTNSLLLPAGWFHQSDPMFSLAVTGQPQNDRNDLAGYYSNHMRYDAEIEAYLRTDHWQNEKKANQDHHPVWF